jgi:NodT family efflux transporter outer membrane factor (OMF) lipoprotein
MPHWRSRGAAFMWVMCLSLLVALGTGCTPWGEYLRNGFKVGPNFRKPPAPVAPQWIDANDIRVRSQSDDLSQWWTVFNDPVLNSLIVDAYRQNLTLRDAGFRVLMARAQLGVSIGGIFPQTQNMSGDHFRESISSQTANRSFVQQRFFNQRDFGFNLNWELDFWGRFRRAIESAGENMNASVENYDDVLVTLLGDIATQFVTIRTLERQIEFTRQNVELQRETLVLAEARFRGGSATDLDVQQARSILEQTAAQVPVLEINLRQASNRLCILMGIPPQDLQQRLGVGDIPTPPKEIAAGIPADLLRRRPDVRRAERLAAAQSAQIGYAASEFYPHITLVGTLDYAAQDLHHLFTPGAFQSTIGPAFSWNLLNYGRILNNVRAQEAYFQQLVVDYQNTVLTAASEAENGLILYLKAQEQTEFQIRSVDAAKKAVQLAVVQYRGGLVDFNRVASLETNLVTQQNTLAQARGQIAAGLINVYRALGGGWQIRLNPPPLDTSGTQPVSPAPPKDQPIEPIPTPKPGAPNPAADAAVPWRLMPPVARSS